MSSSYFLLAFTSSYLFEALTGEAGPNLALKMEMKKYSFFLFKFPYPSGLTVGRNKNLECHREYVYSMQAV
jgi:hypothetical protein